MQFIHPPKKERGIKISFFDSVKIGSWISLAHPAIAEIMAKSGFDWLAVDLEHSVITIREAEELIRVIEFCGVTPFVRLAENDPCLIKRVMDAGAHGIIVPMVNCADNARSAVQAAHYAPRGARGVGLARAQGYGAAFSEYRAWSRDNIQVVVQIEHIDAIHHLKEIFAVEGVSAYIVGPYDLSSSMGLAGQFDHPEFCKVLHSIHSIASNCGIPGGIHIVEPNPDELVKVVEQGARMVAYSVDIRMIDVACRQGLTAVRDKVNANDCCHTR